MFIWNFMWNELKLQGIKEKAKHHWRILHPLLEKGSVCMFSDCMPSNCITLGQNVILLFPLFGN